MLTCLENLNSVSFAILDGHDKNVILMPSTPTWDEDQPPQYRRSHRHPHRLVRLPQTDSVSVIHS